jgi:hypothetical protein
MEAMKGPCWDLLDLFELPPPCAIKEEEEEDDDDSDFDSDIDDNFYDIFDSNSDDDDSDYYDDKVPLSSWCYVYVKVNKKVSAAPTVENVNHDDHKDDDEDNNNNNSSLSTLISLPFLFSEFNLKSISYLLLDYRCFMFK